MLARLVIVIFRVSCPYLSLLISVVLKLFEKMLKGSCRLCDFGLSQTKVNNRDEIFGCQSKIMVVAHRM